MTKVRRYASILGALLALTMVAASCGDSDTEEPTGGTTVEGSLNISGSSTVDPITSLVAEGFNGQNPDVDIAVEGPGTSDGFELFCNGETDINDASRPIEEEEVTACEENGVEYVELEVAQDALSVIGNPSNPVTCLAFGDLYALFGPESDGIDTWAGANDLATEVGGNASLPDLPLTIVAPGPESGTYGSFIDIVTEGIAEEQGVDPADVLRDYQSSDDDNVIVENAAGTEGGLGYVGFAYAENAGESVKEFEVDGGDGCVAPSAESVQDASYPISRSLYIYVSLTRLEENAALGPFVDYYLSDEGLANVATAGYVELPSDRVEATRSAWGSS